MRAAPGRSALHSQRLPSGTTAARSNCQRRSAILRRVGQTIPWARQVRRCHGTISPHWFIGSSTMEAAEMSDQRTESALIRAHGIAAMALVVVWALLGTAVAM